MRRRPRTATVALQPRRAVEHEPHLDVLSDQPLMQIKRRPVLSAAAPLPTHSPPQFL
jgi:hypothetical protein